MTHILHTRTVHKTASLADESNSAYCQSSGADIKYKNKKNKKQHKFNYKNKVNLFYRSKFRL